MAMDLYHGALVDCGTEIDALIPINEIDWMTLRDHITIGTELEVKVTEIRSKWWRFRYPLEVLPTRQDLVHMIGRHPHPHGSPINVYAGEDWKEACRDAGREPTEETEWKTVDPAEADRERYIEDFKRDSTPSELVGQLSEYEKEMLAAGVDDDGTNLSYTKALEARMSGEGEFEDEGDDDDELYDDDVDRLENEDLDENDDDDDDDSGAPYDELSSDMRGGSMKIRDKFDDDEDDDEAYEDDDEDDGYPGAR